MSETSLTNKALRAVLYVICTLPLLVVPWTIFPTHFAKVMFFLLTIGVGSAVLFYEIWQTKRRRSFSHPSTRIFILWLAVALAASVLGENFGRSLGGVYFRNTGLILWFALFGFFVLLNSALMNRSDWRKLLKYFVVVGAVVGGIGIIQRFVTVWPGLIDQSGRVSSTIGNPIFLAAYLIIVLFLTGYVAATAPTARMKYLWAATALVPLFGIYFTESAGAFVGLASGLLITGIIILLHSKKRAWIIAASVGLLIMLAGGFLFMNNRDTLLKSSLEPLLSPLSRLSYISWNSTTAVTRRMAWEMGLRGVAARPVLGWGMANFETVADRYYNPNFLQYSFAETVWDTPHNVFIEIASEEGLVGLVVFIALIISAFVALYRNKDYNLFEKSILAGALVAYLAQDNFGIDTVSSLIGFVILLALMAAPRPWSEKKLTTWPAISALGVITVIAVVLWYGAIDPLRVAVYLNNADTAQIYGNNGEAWEKNALVALDYHGLYAGDFSLALARNILDWDGTNNLPYLDLKKGFLTLVTSLEQAEKDHPNHFNYHYYLGQLYQVKAEQSGDKTYFARAEQELLRARELSPDRQVVSFMLGKDYFLSNQFDKAAAELKKVVELYPQNPEAHLYYGLILTRLGQIDAGAEQLLFVVKADYKGDDPTFLPQVALILSDNKDYKHLMMFYDIYSSNHPENKSLLVRLAEAQYLAGEHAAAEATVLRLKQAVGTDTGSNIDTAWDNFKKRNR